MRAKGLSAIQTAETSLARVKGTGLIADIPSERDFTETGLSLLDQAWDMVVGLLADLESSDQDDDPEITAEFWEAARQRLMTSAALAQQAVEFLVKGRIAGVSPYLLISGSPRDWPRGCDKRDVAFSEFRTVDAQDLVRAHDAVASSRLGPDFASKYEELRKKRNVVMHTVDRNVIVHAKDVIGDILAVHRMLYPKVPWFGVRRQLLERSPIAKLHSTDFVEQTVVWENELVSNLLGPEALAMAVGLDRVPDLICPHCAHASDYLELLPGTAALSEDRSSVSCYVCGRSLEVSVVECECGSGLVVQDSGRCLSCGDWIA